MEPLLSPEKRNLSFKRKVKPFPKKLMEGPLKFPLKKKKRETFGKERGN